MSFSRLPTFCQLHVDTGLIFYRFSQFSVKGSHHPFHFLEHTLVVLAVAHTIQLSCIFRQKRQRAQFPDIPVVTLKFQVGRQRQLLDQFAGLLCVRRIVADPLQHPDGSSPFILGIDSLSLAHDVGQCRRHLLVAVRW